MGSDYEMLPAHSVRPVGSAHSRNAFLTTKLGGMGMGLSLRSIIEAHGARPRETANAPHGAIFHLSLPVGLAPSAS